MGVKILLRSFRVRKVLFRLLPSTDEFLLTILKIFKKIQNNYEHK